MIVARIKARFAGGLPALVSLGIHAVLIAAAAFWVVSETIVSRKKPFEAPPPADLAPRKQVEHRLQVARKSGAVSASPAATSRILSTAAGGLTLPPMPEVGPAAGMGGFGGFGAGMGIGSGTSGMGTGLGDASLGNHGFMSLSFLGLTNVRAQKVVFVVDVGRSLMDIRKGGFQAFGIIRAEIMKLVGNLPPSAEFGVVLFDGLTISRTGTQLQAATVKNKTGFFQWLEPVNTKLDNLGLGAGGRYGRRGWEPQAVEGLNPDYNPSPWLNALHAGMEMGPDTVFVITGAAGYGSRKLPEADLAIRRRGRESDLEFLRKQGLDLQAVTKARLAALAQARKELEAINRQRVSQKKDPFVVTESRRILDPDFQSALARAGHAIKVDLAGWSDKEGRPVWVDPDARLSDVEAAEISDAQAYVAGVQAAYMREKSTINLFFFTGPDERPQATLDGFTQVARRFNGRFELLTTRRLEALSTER